MDTTPSLCDLRRHVVIRPSLFNTGVQDGGEQRAAKRGVVHVQLELGCVSWSSFEVFRCFNILAIIKAMESDGDKATAVGCPSETVSFEESGTSELQLS